MSSVELSSTALETMRADVRANVVVPRSGRAHLVGIGGAGMRALASVLEQRGWEISGSERSCQRRSELSARPWIVYADHDASSLPVDADLVVYSDAIPGDNPERQQAAALGIPTFSYFEMLGRVLGGQQQLAVAGTHGKSTTAAMLAGVLMEAKLDPTIVCGAAPRDPWLPATGGRSGDGRWAVVEACEYRANFLHLRPQVAVLTGVEPDHFDFYRTEAELHAAFGRFVRNVPRDGLLLVRDTCAVSRELARHSACRVETFGETRQADWQLAADGGRRGSSSVEILRGGRSFCRTRLKIAGRHNVFNAVAAAALAHHAGANSRDIVAGLAKFGGLQRRMHYLGRHVGVEVWDDYAHHPTEIDCTLSALRRLYPHARLVCVFQPHQASRTARLLDGFVRSLAAADVVAVADIFRAREGRPKTGEVSAAELTAGLQKIREKNIYRGDNEKNKQGQIFDCHPVDEILCQLRLGCRPNDVVVTLGAGDIWKLSHAFADRI